MVVIFKRGRFLSHATVGRKNQFENGDQLENNCMIVEDDRIIYIGQEADAVIDHARERQAKEVDLGMKLVVPGFIDGHCHILGMGLALGKLDLQFCKNLSDIRTLIKDYAAQIPSSERILCRGWVQDTTGGEALASMLDDLDSRPIYIDANDLHSTWCNNAALIELGVDTMLDPLGGKIHRDANGKPSGLLSESAAMGICWPFLEEKISKQEKEKAILRAIRHYHTAGYTSLVDMAMSETEWEILLQLQSQGKLQCRIAVY
jgi:predicted amidohydrolase YtcJ